MEKTFDAMLEFEKKKQYEIDHLYGGRKDRTPTVKERVEITLKYNRQIYLTDSCFIV